MKAKIKITLKRGVLDPQGKAIQGALGTLGFAGVEDVRQGKYIELDLAHTDAAKAKSQNEAAKKLDEIQRKKNDIGTFAQNTQRSLQQRLQNFRSLMLEEISKIASDVGKRKGATLLLDKAGPTLIGVSSVIYADASYEITDDVMKEINKDRPAAPVAPAPAAAAAPAATETPKITVPGVSTK